MNILEKIMKVPVECYSRVVGYFRPTSQWNEGKQEEFIDRKTINANKLASHRRFKGKD